MVSTKKQIKDLKQNLEELELDFNEFKAASEEVRKQKLLHDYEDFKQKYQWQPDQPIPEPEPDPTPDPTPTPDVPPTPPVTAAGTLWQSKGIWDNGKARTLTKHHEYDPFDKLSEVAAGGHGIAREWRIPGDTDHSFLSGGMSRVYTHTPHQGKIQFETTFIWNNSLDNLSLEFFSRHNEGGDVSGKPTGWNRFGGVTVSYHKDTVESKMEYYHAVYTKGQSKNLPKSLVDGQAYPIKVLGERTVNGDNGEYTLEPFIDDGSGMKSLGTFTQKCTKQQAPSFSLQPLYWRWRVNGTAPKDVEVKEMRFIQL